MMTVNQDAIVKAIKAVEKVNPSELILHNLAGDASDRRYYRADYFSFNTRRTVVVMDILDVENICKSEEVTLYHDNSGELPFINIHRFLSEQGAPVPKILHFDRNLGIMILEDLGDDLLLTRTQNAHVQNRRRLYQKAVDVLILMQVRSENKRPESRCVAFTQTFAPELLLWEFNHYLEFGIEVQLGVTIDKSDRAILHETFSHISGHIAKLPRVFTHRDYHSRNLMVKGDEIFMIDFQDALYGPLHYDLASLVRDSYIDLGDELRDELVEYYRVRYEQASGNTLDPEAFARDLGLVALQRNLKAAGRFVFIDKIKGNPSYLESIPRTLGYVARDLAVNPDLKQAAEVLCKYEKRLCGDRP